MTATGVAAMCTVLAWFLLLLLLLLLCAEEAGAGQCCQAKHAAQQGVTLVLYMRGRRGDKSRRAP